MINAILVALCLGALLGIVLGVASKVFEVKEDERYEVVVNMLPGYNCGACGFPGCSGLTNALLEKQTNVVTCKPCKPDRLKEIVEYLNSTKDSDGNNLSVKSWR